MFFKVDPKVFEQHPDLKIGVIIIRGFNNIKRNSAVESLLRGICAQRGRQFLGKDLSEEKKIRAWHDAYGRFGINPKKFPPSIDALLKRVSTGNQIPHVNLLVDLYNYYSLKYLLPIGGEDLDWLCDDLDLTFTKGDESFRPIGSIEVKQVKEGEIAYKDRGGITSRYWNHRECERTKFTTKSANAALFIEDLSKMHMDEFGEVLKDVQTGLVKYIGGQIESYIITEDSNVIDLGVEGRKNADDSKVPQQEKAHFLQEAKKKQPKSKSVKAKKSDSLILRESSLFKEKVRKSLDKAIKVAFPEVKISANIEYPADDTHGDYASNVAMQLNRDLKMAPREIAEKIVTHLKDEALISKVEIAGPGFINLFLAEELIAKEVQKILKEKENYTKLSTGKDQKIIVEYSSPNIAKPLGVHHLPTTILGQSLANILKEVGFKAITINHLGDWGTQFGKLITAYKKWGDKATIEKNPIDELLKLYVKFHDEAEKDPTLEDEGRKEFKKFEEGDEKNRKLWQWFVDVSLIEINAVYDQIGGIKFDYWQGESFYEDKLQALLENGKKLGIFVEGEEGAYIVKYQDENIPPFVVQKKDGATLYSTRDFAALQYRIKKWDPIKVLYVVDIAQTMHFKQLFNAASRFPWYQDQGIHVWFGRMHMKDGAMSTRKGKVVKLQDLLEEAVVRAKKIIEEKSPELDDKDNVARVVGIGAIKYNILSQNRTTDITFDWNTMLSLDGNSGPYLQYTYARAKSILRKAKDAEIVKDSNEDEANSAQKTQAVVRLLPKFREQLVFAAQELKPNILSNYLYELSQRFNSFYNTVPVLKTDSEAKQKERLEIVEAVSYILKTGLSLLSVEVVEEM